MLFFNIDLYMFDKINLLLTYYLLLDDGSGAFRRKRRFVRKYDDQRVGVSELDGVVVIDIEPVAAIAQSF